MKAASEERASLPALGETDQRVERLLRRSRVFSKPGSRPSPACRNHLHRVGVYQLGVLDHFLCSQCALIYELLHYDGCETTLTSDEHEKLRALNTLYARMIVSNDQLTEARRRLDRRAQRADLSHSQTLSAMRSCQEALILRLRHYFNQAYERAGRQLEQEKQSVLEASLAVSEMQKSLAGMIVDVEENYQRIVMSMDSSPFKAILKVYESELSSISCRARSDGTTSRMLDKKLLLDELVAIVKQSVAEISSDSPAVPPPQTQARKQFFSFPRLSDPTSEAGVLRGGVGRSRTKVLTSEWTLGREVSAEAGRSLRPRPPFHSDSASLSRMQSKALSRLRRPDSSGSRSLQNLSPKLCDSTNIGAVNESFGPSDKSELIKLHLLEVKEPKIDVTPSLTPAQGKKGARYRVRQLRVETTPSSLRLERKDKKLRRRAWLTARASLAAHASHGEVPHPALLTSRSARATLPSRSSGFAMLASRKALLSSESNPASNPCAHARAIRSTKRLPLSAKLKACSLDFSRAREILGFRKSSEHSACKRTEEPVDLRKWPVETPTVQEVKQAGAEVERIDEVDSESNNWSPLAHRQLIQVDKEPEGLPLRARRLEPHPTYRSSTKSFSSTFNKIHKKPFVDFQPSLISKPTSSQTPRTPNSSAGFGFSKSKATLNGASSGKETALARPEAHPKPSSLPQRGLHRSQTSAIQLSINGPSKTVQADKLKDSDPIICQQSRERLSLGTCHLLAPGRLRKSSTPGTDALRPGGTQV